MEGSLGRPCMAKFEVDDGYASVVALALLAVVSFAIDSVMQQMLMSARRADILSSTTEYLETRLVDVSNGVEWSELLRTREQLVNLSDINERHTGNLKMSVRLKSESGKLNINFLVDNDFESDILSIYYSVGLQNGISNHDLERFFDYILGCYCGFFSDIGIALILAGIDPDQFQKFRSSYSAMPKSVKVDINVAIPAMWRIAFAMEEPLVRNLSSGGGIDLLAEATLIAHRKGVLNHLALRLITNQATHEVLCVDPETRTLVKERCVIVELPVPPNRIETPI